MKKISLLFLVLLLTALCGAAQDYPRGDVSQNGQVGIEDVSVLIDYLLSGEWPEDEPATQTYTVNGVSFKMIYVEGGTFMMGATEEQVDDAEYNEVPVHQVTVSSFNISQTQVTQELWLAVMGNNPSYFRSPTVTENLNRPVEQVTWNDCQEFIVKLNELTGLNFRMLTEAEWEFAARGGNKSHGYKYSGSDDIDEVAWIYSNIPPNPGQNGRGYGPEPVATKKPNELGIYDMSGNVVEWVQDRNGSYTSEPQIDPTGSETGMSRMARGGSWRNGPGDCRVSYRFSQSPNWYFYDMGLRLAL